MDKLARQLRDDAERIEVTVSDELERRIDASLHAVTQERPQRDVVRAGRPALFWWASTVTGVAAAVAVITIFNSQTALQPERPAQQPVLATVPSIDWQTETATLTLPLQQELEDLQADIRKAEEKVKRDIGL